MSFKAVGEHLHTNKIYLSHKMVYSNFWARLTQLPNRTFISWHPFPSRTGSPTCKRATCHLTDGSEYLQPRDHEWTSNVFTEEQDSQSKHPRAVFLKVFGFKVPRHLPVLFYLLWAEVFLKPLSCLLLSYAAKL